MGTHSPVPAGTRRQPITNWREVVAFVMFAVVVVCGKVVVEMTVHSVSVLSKEDVQYGPGLIWSPSSSHSSERFGFNVGQLPVTLAGVVAAFIGAVVLKRRVPRVAFAVGIAFLVGSCCVTASYL